MKRYVAAFGAGFLLAFLLTRESRGRVKRFIGVGRSWRRRYLWRDPDDRLARSGPEAREKMMDKTLADSFPASDPPSSIPNPSDDSLVA